MTFTYLKEVNFKYVTYGGLGWLYLLKKEWIVSITWEANFCETRPVLDSKSQKSVP